MVRRVELDPAQVRPGSTLRPIARFESGSASSVLGRAEIFEREPLEFAVAQPAWDGDPKAAVAVVTAAADAVEGRAAGFVPVIARCVARTSDRTDALIVARHGGENRPMMAARRSGADPDATPWHKWLFVRAC